MENGKRTHFNRVSGESFLQIRHGEEICMQLMIDLVEILRKNISEEEKISRYGLSVMSFKSSIP